MPNFLNLLSRGAVATLLAVAACGVTAKSHRHPTSDLLGSDASPAAHRVPAAGTIEVAFSPDEGAEALVVRVIDASKHDLRILAYSFTSAPVVAALLRAKKRGVTVRLVVDHKNNTSEDRSRKARAALTALTNASIDVRTIRRYPIHHDKVTIVDEATVELGSFNYSAAAAHRNSENVLVNWNNKALATVYLKHFDRNYRQSEPFVPRY